MTAPAVGFIGFGEVATAISEGLRGAGVHTLHAYDVLACAPEHAVRMRERAGRAGALLVDSVADMVRSAEVIFSAVVPSAAMAVAAETAMALTDGHVFVDLNSTAPTVKRRMQEIIEATGASFVEAAVMGPVPKHGHRVPLLLCGRGAGEFAARLTPYGMNLEVLGEVVGQASAIKMFRSVLVKGVEALLLECLLGARRCGVDARVLASLETPFDWAERAHYLLGRAAVHGERRGHEMEQVAETLAAVEVAPIMVSAAARRLLWVAGLGIDRRFPDGPPQEYTEVLDAIEEVLSR